MSDARAPRGAQRRIGAAINGKWQIDARIGSGGMATVYAATHRNGHRAAIKMLHANLSRDPSTRARFLREGYVANAVGHPGVVAVLDDGVAEDGAAFLVLELLEGETVEARRLRQGGTLGIDEVLAIADDVLDALAAAHAKGIVHRDLKPDNVFLTTAGEVKLLDFGLARMKELNTEATATGVTLGTPEFMPPEQAMGLRDQMDARTDLWALGATLFTALTGRHVHDAQTVHEQLIASATRRPKPIRQVAPALPGALAQVIDRALELEMSDRWESAAAMRAALHKARAALRPANEGKGARPAPDSETITNAAPLAARVVDENEDRLATNTTEAFALPPQSDRRIDFDETHLAAPPGFREAVEAAGPPSHRLAPPQPSNRVSRPAAREAAPAPPQPSNRVSLPAAREVAPVSSRGSALPPPPRASNRPPAPQPSNRPPPPRASNRPPAPQPSNRPPAPQATTRLREPLPLPASNRRSRPDDVPLPLPLPPSSRRSRPDELGPPVSVRRSLPAAEEVAPPSAGRRSFPAPEELLDPATTFPPNVLPSPSIQPHADPPGFGPASYVPPATPSSPLPLAPRSPPAAGKPVLLVFVVLIALCAAMGAYVLSRGAP